MEIAGWRADVGDFQVTLAEVARGRQGIATWSSSLCNWVPCQMPPLDRDPCPCDSTRTFAECCGRWHAGAPAPDAQSLMRSRYSAFVLCNEQYLLATWHPRTRPDSIPFSKNQKWLGLRIVDTRVSGDDSAEVEFIARSKVSNAPAVRLHERSRFVRESGRWFYVDGDLLE
jgi:SEC-C motif-containing protein